ncbi:MAG: glycosyltransferase family 4 protein [Patescibacteria group bacterium]
MRIAMVGQKGIPTHFGGIERHVEHLSIRLGKAGHEVLVYTRSWFGSANDNYAQGVRAVVTPTCHTKHLDAIVHTFTSTLHAIRANVDVIHYHGVGPSLLSWLPRVFAPHIKVVATFHCIDRHHQKWNVLAQFILGIGERFACLFPHRTIAVSQILQEYCREKFNAQVDYVPNGIQPPSALAFGDTKTLDKFGLEPDGYIVLVSRLVRHKGVHHLINAYRELQQSGKTGGKKCVIVGGSAFTDDYVDELLTLVEGDADIVFTGYQEGRELAALFANAYLVVHPSESEGLPIAVLEAMSYGKTVLASDIPENLEVTRNHGMNFRNRDAHDLAKKLEFLFGTPSFVTALGEEARRFVEVEYHWDDIARSVNQVYQSLVSQPENSTNEIAAASIR